MFAQADSSVDRARSGLGIGLTLVKKRVEMHQGVITAYSKGVGQGSKFIVCLPLVRLHSTAPLVSVSEQSEEKPQTPHHILVVDDNKASAQTMGWAVEALSHEAQLAFDGQSAVELAKAYHPDIILLDIGLPAMNGYEVCRLIRRDAKLRHALLIAQTGWGQYADRQRVYAAGFDHHLVKPIDMKLLKQLIPSFDRRDQR